MGLLQEQPEQAMPAEQPGQATAQPEQVVQGGGEAGQAEKYVAMGVDILYGKLFDKMITMFKKNGEEGFSQSMAVAVNKVIGEIEKVEPISPEIAAAVGMKIFFMLLEDVIKGGIVPKVEVQQIKIALSDTMAMYAKSHKETVTDAQMAEFVRVLADKERQAMGAAA